MGRDWPVKRSYVYQLMSRIEKSTISQKTSPEAAHRFNLGVSVALIIMVFLLLLCSPWKETIDLPFHLHTPHDLSFAWIWSPTAHSPFQALIDWSRLFVSIHSLLAITVLFCAVTWLERFGRNNNLPIQFQRAGEYPSRRDAMRNDSRSLAVNCSKVAGWYRKADERGHAEAQFTLAEFHLDGKGVQPDEQTAPFWCDVEEESALRSYCAQDYTPATVWYGKSARRGDALAQYNLGYSYELGHGVPQDFVKAANLYRRAAEQGLPKAEFRLGLLFYEG
jgi:hypothetical protein